MVFFQTLFVGFIGLTSAIFTPFKEFNYPIEPIPKLNAVLSETSVSGFSSGAYFATQFHVSHSSWVKGAGMVAGGPYGCVHEHPLIFSCIGRTTSFNPIRDDILFSNMQKLAAENKIDPLENIKHQRLFVYGGLNDSLVHNPAVKGSNRLYQKVIDPANYLFEEIIAEHNYPNDFDAPPGNSKFSSCDKVGLPHISNCQYDATGRLLTHIYGPMNPRNPPSNPQRKGRFMKFDQKELLNGVQSVNTSSPFNIGLGPHGFLYIPDDCKVTGGMTAANRCKLHVVFHGCTQHLSGIHGMYFMANTGFINYADTNKLILAFPQTVINPFAPNWNTIFPLFHPSAMIGCWDFLGMYDAEYHTKNGRQIQAIRNLIGKIVA